MARPTAHDLPDAEKRDLIQVMQTGKALPEKYRFLLFGVPFRAVVLLHSGPSCNFGNYPASVRRGML